MGGSQTSSEPSTTCIFWMSRAYVIGSFCLRIRDSKRQFLVKVIYLTENSTYISLSVTHFLMGSLSFSCAICFTLCLWIEHDSKSDWLKKFFGVSFVGRDCEIVLASTMMVVVDTYVQSLGARRNAFSLLRRALLSKWVAFWSWIPLLWKLNRAAGKEQKEQIPWGAVTNYNDISYSTTMWKQ